MLFTKEDVRKVANLARLEFDDAELDAFCDQMTKIVDFVQKLNEVDTEGVEEMAHPLDLHSVLREDELRAGLSRSQALANAPQHDDEFFLVPPVLTKSR